MGVCACKLIKTIQVNMIWHILFDSLSIWLICCIPFLFAINVFVKNMIVSFHYAFKREILSCEGIIDTSY